MDTQTQSGQSVVLSMQNQAARKEWRAVTEGSAQGRMAGDGAGEAVRVNGSARMRVLHQESPRNGRMFRSGGSASSSDSDHHRAGESTKHSGVSQTVAVAQSDEIQGIHQHDSTLNGHLDSALNGLPLELDVVSSSNNPNETTEHLHDVIRQREQLQHLEAELRAQFIVRSEVLRVQSNYDEQIKQQASIAAKLQENLQEREQRIHQLEQQLEEREQQLHANQREANEAVNQVWAKDGLLREQTNELATMRRERDNMLTEQNTVLGQFEADKAKCLSQLHDMEEQVQEKERQFLVVDEQRQNAQDALVYKDEQLKEAQAWIQRAQELDAFHANTNSSLHAELRDRTEQMNQLWLGHQRQLAEMERYHAQTIQRLRVEIAELKEQNRMLKTAYSPDKVDNKGEQSALLNNRDSGRFNVTDQPAGTFGKVLSRPAIANNQVEHAPGLPVPASQAVGPTPVLPTNSIPVLHQFTGRPKGTATPSPITQPGLSQFSYPVIMQTTQRTTQQLPGVHQQVRPGQTMQHNFTQMQQPQASHVQRLPDPQQLQIYSHFPEAKPAISVQPRGISHHQQQSEQAHDQLVLDQGGTIHTSNLPAIYTQLQAAGHMQHHESSQILEEQIQRPLQVQHAHEEKTEAYAQTVPQQELKQQQLEPPREVEAQQSYEQHGQEVEAQQSSYRSVGQALKADQTKTLQPLLQQPGLHSLQLSKDLDLKAQPIFHPISTSSFEEKQLSRSHPSGFHPIANVEGSSKHELTISNMVSSTMHLAAASDGSNNVTEHRLLDEKSLLACLVRAIPSEASARIRIGTTLPNRLAKMLAPLHWHDYRKRYGRLDEFVSSHPELFVIDGDFIHLREGAHAIISAKTTVAKVAAAAASPVGINWPPTVAVTPVAQSQPQRLRKVPVSRQLDRKQGPPIAHVHSINGKHEELLPQVQKSGSGDLIQGIVAKDTGGKSMAGMQRVVTVMEPRPDGLAFNASNIKTPEFKQVASNGCGSPAAVTRKNGIMHGSRQATRNTMEQRYDGTGS